jgi:glucose-6-phosphate isomerase
MPASKKSPSAKPNPTSSQTISEAGLQKEIQAQLKSLEKADTAKRLFLKDAKLWKSDKETIDKINNRLGWLQLPDDVKHRVRDITTFANEAKKEGFKYAVLLGMGGSSLCSEVALETFGTKKGYLELFVLDDTDPEAIHAIQDKIKIEKTLFIVASKSGNTKESISFFEYFYALMQKKLAAKAGNNFVAITDAGTPLVDKAKQHKFRKTFINPGDIGGRYSVLSDFGLLPMALIGVDIAKLMKSALDQENATRESKLASNPGITLGAALGVAALNGRDKVTFVLSKSIAAFGYWVEQLIAESTGKEGKGLIPINGEEVGAPDVYGKDRIFIYISTQAEKGKGKSNKVDALEAAGHPVVRISLADDIALGGEYYRWEVATAIAGKVLGINPFDEPNVAESKKNTENILEEWQAKKDFAPATPKLANKHLSIYTGGKADKISAKDNSTIEAFIQKFTGMAKKGDYIALLPYFYKTDHRTKFLQAWRQQLRDEYKVATTLLHGPRYLHSTGQLHKGGPDTGLYIIITADEDETLAIPSEQYGFEVLHHAQALGDFRSLSDKGRRVIRINLGKDLDAGLKELWKTVKIKKDKK